MPPNGRADGEDRVKPKNSGSPTSTPATAEERPIAIGHT
jgi:hypothetical protein